MFTGLVAGQGRIEQIVPEPAGVRLRIAFPPSMCAAAPLVIGESIAINGCCLTVVPEAGEGESVDQPVTPQRSPSALLFSSVPYGEFQAGSETLSKTNLGQLQPGDHVNFERSLLAGDRLGGHMVQGHVDCTALVDTLRQEDVWVHLSFRVDPQFARLMVPKGSVAVDGVSLTVVEAGADHFSVALIPHTLAETTLGRLQPGDRVNIETDILGKYVDRLLAGRLGDLSR